MGLVGAILGDIAGSRFEFQWDEGSLNYRRYNDYELFTEHNFATDDSFMSIATMKACETDLDFAKWYREYGNKYPASYGGRFGMWLFNKHMGPYNSFGNGSAMRVSYIGEKYPIEQVEEMATKSAEVTHNHEEGIKGAVVTATCIAMARDGKDKEEILEYGISKYNSKARYYPYRFGCDRAYNDYKDETKMDETCMVSVPIAIRCFYESSSFEECMRMINSLCCDTDTIGAIAGAICESYYGSCLGSKEADYEMMAKYLPPELYDEVVSVLGEVGEENSDKKSASSKEKKSIQDFDTSTKKEKNKRKFLWNLFKK